MRFSILLAVLVWAVSFDVASAQESRLLTRGSGGLLDETTSRKVIAAEVGKGFFGVDERVTNKNERKFRGTIAEEQFPVFKVGDWGYTTVIFEVLTVVSKDEILVLPTYKDANPVLIRGLTTEKVTTGAKFLLQHPVKVQKTYNYTTVDATTEKIVVLEPLSQEDVDEILSPKTKSKSRPASKKAAK